MKKSLGQFYTTNYEYILQGMLDKIPSNITIIEPFAGDKDLVKNLRVQDSKTSFSAECYDIAPLHSDIIKRDTLMDPPAYSGRFILTNPPYLARNKNTNKQVYDKYGVDDLYKAFIKELCLQNAYGGIIIVPLNFLCAMRKCDVDLRKQFITKYDICSANIFEEQVFDDTTYVVCSIYFKNKLLPKICNFEATIYPSKTKMTIVYNENNGYIIGGEIYRLPAGKYKIDRLTKNNKTCTGITNILAKCIDDSAEKRICLLYSEKPYIDETPNLSARSFATLVINPPISAEMQKAVISKFNEYLEEHRKKYNSLFLANYRESKKDIARKRIPFILIYTVVGYLLEF